MKVAMVSLPMNGLSEEEVKHTYNQKTYELLHNYGFDATVHTLFEGPEFTDEALKENGVKNIPLYFLAKSLERMAECDMVYFCKGWENARGCQMEYEAASKYGIGILTEVGDEKFTR